MTNSSKNVLIIELNEFNVELLEAAVSQIPLAALEKVLSFTKTHYKTQDRYNSGYLEPWVQWVSIHTGVSAKTHRIKHLGDVPDLGFNQCWETLSQHDITTGIWGVMNGARKTASNTLFFLPDPWTFSEEASPKKLQGLLSLPRYISKHYQDLSVFTLIKKGLSLIKFIMGSGACGKIFLETIDLLKNLKHFGKKHFVFISYFDVISTLLFIQYQKKFKARCAILFLNSLAHLQHHHWHSGPTTLTPELSYGLKKINQLLALLLEQYKEQAIIVHNGLSQMNTNHEKPWVLYRQKNPLRFFQAIELAPQQVEQHMTHDGHAFFADPEACLNAYALLKRARMNHKPLFHVEKNSQDPCKLFYQLCFTDDLDLVQDREITFSFDQKEYPFFEHFDKMVTRTGRHIPVGTVYSNIIPFADQIYNHNFNTYVFNYLRPDLFPLRENIEQALFEHAGEEEIA